MNRLYVDIQTVVIFIQTVGQRIIKALFYLINTIAYRVADFLE